jgi:hypothetical protein
MSDNEVINWWKKKKFPRKISKATEAKWNSECACCGDFIEQGFNLYFIGDYGDSDIICENCKEILEFYFDHGNGD